MGQDDVTLKRVRVLVAVKVRDHHPELPDASVTAVPFTCIET